jgi:predicted DNA-binding protein
MKAAAGKNPQSGGSVRASISFPPEVYRTLENIARDKKVSLAWVVREAVDSYIENKWPLFAQKN